MMWTFCSFDLPTKKEIEKQYYTRFRKHLMRCGFFMLQYSVYVKYSDCEESDRTAREEVKRELPPVGAVRIYSMTDAQYERMGSYRRGEVVELEKPIPQLQLF
jgi:CRISPR-associated protein Cas2